MTSPTTPAALPGSDFGAADPRAIELRLDASEVALLRCIERIEAIIKLETAQLRAGKPVDFDAFNDRKAYALFEFARLVRSIGKATPPQLLRRLEDLRLGLAENERQLAQNLQALGEITDILVKIVHAEASDGTYSALSATALK